jgi:hypothetical protein
MTEKFKSFVIDNNLEPYSDDYQKDTYNAYKIIKTDLKHNSKTGRSFKIGKIEPHEIIALGAALKDFAPTYKGEMIIKTTNDGDKRNYVRVNPDTISMLENLLEDDGEVNDSVMGFGAVMRENQMVEILFLDNPGDIVPTRGKNRNGEFFPFYNRSELDLDMYGIYRDDIVNDCCLMTALENSRVLTHCELNLLKSSIHTRCINRGELKRVSKQLNTFIKLFTITLDEQYTRKKSAQLPDADWLMKLGCATDIDYYGDGVKFKYMREFNEKVQGRRRIDLILFCWPKHGIASTCSISINYRQLTHTRGPLTRRPVCV